MSPRIPQELSALLHAASSLTSLIGGFTSHEATPKTIMRTMGVKGLTLFHLKSHLQKYRLGKQSNKEASEPSKDAVYPMEGPSSSTNSLSPRVQLRDANEGNEVKEALRAQMEIQRRLHEQVEVEKHLQIRMDSQEKYLNSLFERAIKIAVEQIASTSGIHVSGSELADLLTKAGVNDNGLGQGPSVTSTEAPWFTGMPPEESPYHRRLLGLKTEPGP
ncbi:protein PHR1-LIKE 2-like isoform X2 [Wolffia australiana]